MITHHDKVFSNMISILLIIDVVFENMALIHYYDMLLYSLFMGKYPYLHKCFYLSMIVFQTNILLND